MTELSHLISYMQITGSVSPTVALSLIVLPNKSTKYNRNTSQQLGNEPLYKETNTRTIKGFLHFNTCHLNLIHQGYLSVCSGKVLIPFSRVQYRVFLQTAPLLCVPAICPLPLLGSWHGALGFRRCTWWACRGLQHSPQWLCSHSYNTWSCKLRFPNNYIKLLKQTFPKLVTLQARC